MKLPKLQNTERYKGLYIVDFGDHCGVGFYAEEVAELLESEQFRDIHVYKVHNAWPDGKMELNGVNNKTFELESGMLFYASDEETARRDYQRLLKCTEQADPPARAKVHLARLIPDSYLTALIYPAEYDEEFSRWLLDCRFQTSGAAEGGTGAVTRYYQADHEILDRQQLFNRASVAFSGEDLITKTRQAVVR